MLKALGKMAGRHVANDRVMNAGIQAAKVTAKAAARTTHILFLQMTGLFFTGFALTGAGAAVREYRLYAAGKIGPGKAILAAVFAAVFLYFAVSSFMKAKKR